jgi:hypothetical protein
MIGEQPTLWAAVPAELLALPEELARMDTLPDDPAFFVPLATFFESTMLGRRFRAGGPQADRLTVLVIEPRRLAQSHLRNPERCSLEIRGVGARN